MALMKRGHSVYIISKIDEGQTYNSEWRQPWLVLKPITYYVSYPHGNFAQRSFEVIRNTMRFKNPQEGIRWAEYAYRKAVELIKGEGFDIVMTRSPSDIAHLVGLRLKKKLNPGTILPASSTCPPCILIAMCALLLIRGASESATVNAIMVVIKLGVLAMFVVIAFTAFDADHFADFAPFGRRGHRRGGRHDLLLLHRPRRRVDRRRRGQGPADDDAAGDHRRAADRHHRLRAGGLSRRWAPSRGRSSRTRRRRGWRRSWRTSPAAPGPARSSPPARSSRSSRSPW